jgi:hypothetical protein
MSKATKRQRIITFLVILPFLPIYLPFYLIYEILYILSDGLTAIAGQMDKFDRFLGTKFQNFIRKYK